MQIDVKNLKIIETWAHGYSSESILSKSYLMITNMTEFGWFPLSANDHFVCGEYISQPINITNLSEIKLLDLSEVLYHRENNINCCRN